METAIRVEDVSMLFNLSSEKIDSIKEYLIKTVRRELHYQEFWALKNNSFALCPRFMSLRKTVLF